MAAQASEASHRRHRRTAARPSQAFRWWGVGTCLLEHHEGDLHIQGNLGEHKHLHKPPQGVWVSDFFRPNQGQGMQGRRATDGRMARVCAASQQKLSETELADAQGKLQRRRTFARIGLVRERLRRGARSRRPHPPDQRQRSTDLHRKHRCLGSRPLRAGPSALPDAGWPRHGSSAATAGRRG